MHTDVIYDADLQMSWVNNCVKFIGAKHFILPIGFISYFLANKILSGIICTGIQYYRHSMKEEDKTIFSLHNLAQKFGYQSGRNSAHIPATFDSHRLSLEVQFLNKCFQSWHWKVEHKYRLIFSFTN